MSNGTPKAMATFPDMRAGLRVRGRIDRVDSLPRQTAVREQYLVDRCFTAIGESHWGAVSGNVQQKHVLEKWRLGFDPPQKARSSFDHHPPWWNTHRFGSQTPRAVGC